MYEIVFGDHIIKAQFHERFNSDLLVQTGEHDACLDSDINLYVFGRSGVEPYLLIYIEPEVLATGVKLPKTCCPRGAAKQV